jgi:hypothetical protein
MDLRAIACFDQAMHDVGMDEAGPLRQVLHDYFAWATTTTMSRYHESADQVPEGMSIPMVMGRTAALSQAHSAPARWNHVPGGKAERLIPGTRRFAAPPVSGVCG